MSYDVIHASKTIYTMWSAVALLVGIALVSLKKRSVIATTNLLPVFVLASGLNMSMKINANAPSG